ncbi:MAG: Not1 N-terminal domain, CCR4-Not complex component-domain-containing protein [Benniella sp.]|nr:MAG: Not1 N-terminal domain, CCR4-Not complex component-domain-containing protein [Benniella sp.]
MATRKLQTEIDKVLKKVAEGVETFEETLEKIETSTNANQKDKYETDLKKEIKKLQRLRDQIKTWISSNDIKDKRALMDNRKLIEQQMERFKAIEKEMKTKAYSREGLIMSGRLDPKEKEKAELCSWITDRVEALTIQIEAREAEVETLLGGKKAKGNQAKEKVSQLGQKIERHKWHQGRLELIMRLLENGQIDTEKVTAIQEDVNLYVDENMEPDFEEYEELYADLNLEDEEEFYAVGMEDHSHHDHDDKSKDDHDTTSKKHTKEPEPELSPAKPAAKTIPKKPSVSEPKETKPLPAPSSSTKTAPSNTSSRQPPLPRVASVESPVIQYATAVAANLAPESARAAGQSTSPRVVSATVASKDTAIPSGTSKTETSSPQAATQSLAAIAPSSSVSVPESSPLQELNSSQAAIAAAAAAAAVSSFAAIPVSRPRTSVELSVEATEQSPILPSISQLPSQFIAKEDISAQSPVLPSAPPAHSAPLVPPVPPAQPSPTTTAAEPEIRLPTALADLAHSFEAAKERAISKEVGFFVHQMLDASYQFIPELADTERPKHYAPKNPYPTPSYYPQTPPPGLFENPAMFEKFDVDTLFFIFYYQQGTYQQYLAAKELKKQSWRFHKKYLTWFQRHEEPKVITDDYEQGTYIYFDYEGAWCQRKKTDFRFEYKFLEDSELV